MLPLPIHFNPNESEFLQIDEEEFFVEKKFIPGKEGRGKEYKTSILNIFNSFRLLQPYQQINTEVSS